MDVDKLRTDWPGEPIRAHNRVDCARPLTKQTDDRISPVIKDPPFPTCLCCYGEINRGLTLGGHKSPLFRQCNSFSFFSLGCFFFKWHTSTEHLVKEWYGKYVQYYEDDVDLYRGPHSKRWTALTLSDRTGRGGVAHWHSRNGPVDPVERHQQARRWLRGEDKWRWLEPTCRAGPVIATTSLKSFPCHWFLPLCWNSLANASISHERELRLRLLRYATRMGAALQQLTTIHQSHLRRHRAMNEKKEERKKTKRGNPPLRPSHA